jgi:hypothetical protein
MLGAPAGLGGPLPGIGGGGGAPPDGIGGGGGALPVGSGGGGGAFPVGNGGGGGAPEEGIGGAGGGLVALTGLCVEGVLLSMEDNGRGGAIVPNRSDASCFAPPPGRLSSSSSSEESGSDMSADQSSESDRTRAARVEAEATSVGCCVRRWNGFVDTSEAVGVGVEVAAAASFACAIFFKNGFLVPSADGVAVGGEVTTVRG